MDDAVDLLDGPRGRRLCLELADRLARTTADAWGERYLRAAFAAAYRSDPGRGRSRITLSVAAPGDPAHSAAGTTASGGVPDASTPEQVASLLEAMPLTAVDGPLVREALAAAVDAARYWQQPDGEDVLGAHPAVRRALGRVAAAALAHEEAGWWPRGWKRRGSGR